MAILWRPLLILFTFLAIVVVILVLLISGGGGEEAKAPADKPAAPDKAEPENPDAKAVSAKDLDVGDCVSNANATTGANVTTFDVVACSKRHDGEVFTLIKVAGDRYPGTKVVSAKGQRGCRARLRRQASSKAFANRRLGYKFVYPTPQSWAQDDREVTCLATFSKARTGKLEQRRGASS